MSNSVGVNDCQRCPIKWCLRQSKPWGWNLFVWPWSYHNCRAHHNGIQMMYDDMFEWWIPNCLSFPNNINSGCTGVYLTKDYLFEATTTSLKNLQIRSVFHCHSNHASHSKHQPTSSHIIPLGRSKVDAETHELSGTLRDVRRTRPQLQGLSIAMFDGREKTCLEWLLNDKGTKFNVQLQGEWFFGGFILHFKLYMCFFCVFWTSSPRIHGWILTTAETSDHWVHRRQRMKNYCLMLIQGMFGVCLGLEFPFSFLISEIKNGRNSPMFAI